MTAATAPVLDEVSDHMGEVLRRADELLVEWSRFGAEVRAQVDREAHNVGNAVATAVEGAVARATSTSVDRALAEQIGTKLAALAAEIGRLEGRAKAASRAVVEERRTDRRILWGVVGGIVVANGLLVALLLRRPSEPAAVVAPEPTRVEVPVIVPDAAVAPMPEPLPEPASAVDDGSAAPKPDAKSDKPAKAADKKPTGVQAPPPNLRAVKVGPPAGAKLLAVPPRRK